MPEVHLVLIIRCKLVYEEVEGFPQNRNVQDAHISQFSKLDYSAFLKLWNQYLLC
jgi:hypothetical protein